MSDDFNLATFLAIEAEHQRRMNEGPAMVAFRAADIGLLDALQRVVNANTTTHPLGAPERTIHWTELHEALALFRQKAEERHAAKHAALIETMNAPLPTIYRTKP